ncbi:MAG: ABC transporter permease [Ktedonobacteraceae bacterium]
MSTISANNLPRRLLRRFANQQIILLVVLVVLSLFFTINNPIFFSTNVFANILLDWAPLALIAVGETFVIISGGIDLSVGAITGFSGIIAAFVMRDLTHMLWGETATLLVGLLVTVLVGAGLGLINGLLITATRLVPFVATLVMLGAAGGLSIVLTGGAPIGGGPVNAILLTVPILGPFSIPVIIVVVIVAYLGLVLHFSRFGRYTYAIGSNSFAALVAGINVNRHLLMIYMLSGLLAGLAGMFFYIRLASGAPTSGLNSELDAIAAVVIGGVALAGGVGVLVGTILGALILTTITSGLIIIGVAPDWKQVVVALLIAFAVLAQSLRLTNRSAS